MTLPAHTPYDGTSKPFTMGLRPLDPTSWIEIDETFDMQMAEKRRLFAGHFSDVFVEQPGTRAAQQEVLDMIERHLPAAHPVKLTPDERTLAALHASSLLVQEDLILMRKGKDGWRLAAGALCFPSSWSLREKFGHPLQDIHAPVPGFGRGTRTADLITRMFDNLKVEQPVERFNWSLQARPDLYYPLSDVQRNERASNRPSKFADRDAIIRGFVRVERQTLRKLPRSGDILFTIRIHLDPLKLFATHPRRRELATSFIEQLMAMSDAQLGYKGLTADRERLIEALTAFASEPQPWTSAPVSALL